MIKGTIRINIIDNKIKSFDIDIQVETVKELTDVLEALGVKATSTQSLSPSSE